MRGGKTDDGGGTAARLIFAHKRLRGVLRRAARIDCWSIAAPPASQGTAVALASPVPPISTAVAKTPPSDTEGTRGERASESVSCHAASDSLKT